MKRRTSRRTRRPNPKKAPPKRAANDNARAPRPARRTAPAKAPRAKRVPKRLRALGGADPRELAPGTPYPCDDPRIGTRAAGDTFAGTVLACAVPPKGKKGRHYVVGGIESGAAISSARSRRERTREALRARWEGPDLDARPVRGGRAKAPPPSSLDALPRPEARPRRSLPVIQPKTRRRLPVIQPPPKRRAPEAVGPAWTPAPRAAANAPRTADEKIGALAEAVRLALPAGQRLTVKRKPYFTELAIEGGTDYTRGVDIRHTLSPRGASGFGLREYVGAAWTRGPRPNFLAVLSGDATSMGLADFVTYRGGRKESRLDYLAGALLGRNAPQLAAVLAARPDLDATLRAPFAAFAEKPKKAPPKRAVALRSIVDVLGVEGGPWKPAPMSPIYARTRATANADSAWRDVTEVAKLVRADIAKAIAARQLPKGLTASVRSDKYSMGQSLKVEVIPPPWLVVRVRRPESDYQAQAYGIHDVLSPEAAMIRERVQWIVNRYNRNDSDLSTDYHDVNFYDDVQVGGERAAQEAEILTAERRGEIPVDIALTNTTRRALGIDERREEALYVFAVVPGRAWRVAVWAKGAPMGRDSARERLRNAATLDASDPEEALASARELAIGAGLISE
jgi:hypothetical protein